MIRNHYRGFTLIELLVVIAIIAILAAILFPVFARAREKARQTTCSSNQRQIAASIMMYVQDHEDTMPSTSNIWKDTKIDPGVLICPTAGKNIINAYVYNNGVVNQEMSTINTPNTVMLCADGLTATVGGEVNICYRPGDLAWRHSNKLTASYLDGHVDSVDTLSSDFFNGFGKIAEMIGPTFTSSGISPCTLVYDPTKPAIGNPAADLMSLGYYTGVPVLKKVGSKGYILCQGSWNAGMAQSPFSTAAPAVTGTWTDSSQSINNSPVDPTLQNGSTLATNDHWMRNGDNTANSTVTINFTGFDRHTFTIIMPKQDGGNGSGYKVSMTSATGAGAREVTIPLYNAGYGCFNTRIIQVTSTFPFMLTYTNITTPLSGASRGYYNRAGGIQAIFLD